MKKDYDDGIKDCENGVEADMKRGEDYLAGYSYQYEKEQKSRGFN